MSRMNRGDESLKPGWTRVAFGDVATCVNERIDDPATAGVERYVGLEHLDRDSLTIRRWGSPTDVTATKLRFRKGDIIFGRRRVYQRKLAVADFDGICSAHAMVLRAKSQAVLPEFLPFFMQSDLFMNRAKTISVGSLSPTINWKTLEREEFALPSLAEQRRMQKTMNAVSVANDTLRRVLETSIEVEYSFLGETFGDYGTCPAGMALADLRDVAEIRTGLAKGPVQPDAFTTTMPYLRVANVKDGGLDLREIKDIVVRNDHIERYSLRYGDVLMTEGGDLDKLGRGSVWQEEIGGCLHQNHIYAVRPNLEQIDPWYLAAIVRSQYGRQFFRWRAKRTSNLASVNKKEVSEFKIPMKSRKDQDAWLAEYQRIRNAICSVRERHEGIRIKNLVLATFNDKLSMVGGNQGR